MLTDWFWERGIENKVFVKMLKLFIDVNFKTGATVGHGTQQTRNLVLFEA